MMSRSLPRNQEGTKERVRRVGPDFRIRKARLSRLKLPKEEQVEGTKMEVMGRIAQTLRRNKKSTKMLIWTTTMKRKKRKKRMKILSNLLIVAHRLPMTVVDSIVWFRPLFCHLLQDSPPFCRPLQVSQPHLYLGLLCRISLLPIPFKGIKELLSKVIRAGCLTRI
jgi:hypothetical protein